MALTLAVAMKQDKLDVLDQLDGGTLEIRSGARPASPDDADSGTLLAVLTFGTPAFAAAVGSSRAANAITQDSAANATGTAGHARAKTSGSVAKIDFTVTATGGGGDIEINTTSIVINGAVQVTSLTITEGG